MAATVAGAAPRRAAGARNLSVATSRWPDRAVAARLHVVTGKGGTGKTTVAAALALALATGGRGRCSSRWRTARASPSCSTPRRCRTRSAGSPWRPAAGRSARWPSTPRRRCWSTSRCSTGSAAPGRTLRRMGAIEFATTLAPGLRDVLLTGKVKEARRPHGRRAAPRLRRRGAGRAADRPGRHASSTSPRRWPTWPRAGPIHGQSRGCRRGCCTPHDRRARGDAAGGDAGARRRWRRSTSSRPPVCGSAR